MRNRVCHTVRGCVNVEKLFEKLIGALAVVLAVLTLGVLVVPAAYSATTTSRQPLGVTPRFETMLAAVTSGLPSAPERNAYGFTAAFTRATVSSEFNVGFVADSGSGVVNIGQVPVISGGAFQLPATGALRAYQAFSDDGGNLITFRADQNQVLSNAAWVSTGLTVTDNSATAPDNTATADNLDDSTDLTAGCAVQVTDGFTASTNVFAATTWVKCASGHTVRLILDIGAGSTTTSYSCTSTWTRILATLAGDGVTQPTISLCPTTSNVLLSGNADFWRPQVYDTGSATATTELALPDPVVVGTDIAVNQDSLTYTGGVSPPLPGTFCAWFWSNFQQGTGAPPDNMPLMQWDSTSTFQFLINENGATDTVQWLTSGGNIGNLNSNGVTIFNSTWHLACVSLALPDGVGNTDGHLYLDGAEVAYSTSDLTWSDPGNYGTTLSIGGLAAKGSIHGFERDVRIWGRQLTAAKILSLYNREASSYARLEIQDGARRVMYATLGPMGLRLADALGIPSWRDEHEILEAER